MARMNEYIYYEKNKYNSKTVVVLQDEYKNEKKKEFDLFIQAFSGKQRSEALRLARVHLQHYFSEPSHKLEARTTCIKSRIPALRGQCNLSSTENGNLTGKNRKKRKGKQLKLRSLDKVLEGESEERGRRRRNIGRT